MSMCGKDKRPLGIFTGKNIRKMLLDNPDLPLVFLVNVEEFSGDYASEYASEAFASIGEILDCQQDIAECQIFTGRDDFEDAIRCSLPYGLTDDEIEAETTATLAEYEPYWKKCILVTVGN